MDKLPNHIGIILDGNRRWAKARSLHTFDGHKAGYENIKTIGDVFFARGIKFLTIFAFSTENWNRSKDEVKYLLRLADTVLTKETSAMHKKGRRVLYLGIYDRLNKSLVNKIQKVEELTKNNTKGTVGICFNYGGQQEIADAMKAIMAKGVKPEQITPELISANIYHPEIPPIDIVVRTSGEQRISNFMLWRSAYSEIMFVDKNWPDFDESDVDKVLEEYARRNRRFGGN